ncbi:amidohydrolase family protein [Citricoccus sp. I39-566]|uniref:amidohydrolase family protein n=1 Tax=Citricoccus sp. I39-566 TaxID=3073268 RepID=UPI00286AF851|nr:amidohydrolase family protein [Citricoccus sp. I39-566]WMY78421.1 amidohydrolase family protein [Citricoccus sp. I39-566]
MNSPTAAPRPYRRIATEEAWAPPEMFELFRRILGEHPEDDPGFMSLMGYYALGDGERPRFIRERMVDTEGVRLQEMDAAGVDHQILALTAPGTNPLPAAQATDLARVANDHLGEIVRNRPERFSGLAAVPFTAPDAGAAELGRAVTELGLKGAILNSHVRDRYTDSPEFLPFYEAAASLGVPVYLHPNAPSAGLFKPLHDRGLDGSMYGFGVETGLHLMRLVVSGVFERFPTLKLVVGHLGEAVPFWLNRIDYMYGKQVATGRYPHVKPLPLKPSEYIRRNVWITTSGMPWEDEIMFVRKMMGADRVMYAMDYPYQYEPAEVQLQDDLPLTEEERFEFFEGIATRVFDLSF